MRFFAYDRIFDMAKDDSIDSKINKLTSLVEKGFSALAEDIAGLDKKVDSIEIKTDSIEKEMITGFLRVEERLYSIEQDIKDLKKRLLRLEDNYEAVQTHGDDIKELRNRINEIERQLSMKR